MLCSMQKNPLYKIHPEINFAAIPKILKIDFVYYKYNSVQIWAYYFNKAKSIKTMFKEENNIIWKTQMEINPNNKII